MTGDKFDARGFVTEAHQQGIPDDQIAAALQSQGVPAADISRLMSAMSAPPSLPSDLDSAGPRVATSATQAPAKPPGFDAVGFVREAKAAGVPDADILAALQSQGIDTADPGTVGHYGALNAIVNGLSMGLAPRALAAIDAAMGKDYGRQLRSRLAAKQLYESEHPVASTGANVVGGALPFLAGGELLPAGRTFLGKLAAGASVGGVAGALQGAGSAAPGHVLEGAEKGGGWGAIAGGVLSGAGAALSAGFRRLIPPPQAAAVDLILRTPGLGDDPTVLATLKNQHDLLAQTMPPAGGPTLLAKLRGGDQTEHALSELAKSSPAALEGFQRAAARAAAEAKPLYEQAYAQSIQVTPKIAQALKDPEVATAYEAAAEELGRRGIELPSIRAITDPTAQAVEGLTRELGGAPTILKLAQQMNPSLLAKPENAVFAAALRKTSTPQDLPVEAIDLMKRTLQGPLGRAPSNTAEQVSMNTTRRLLNELVSETDRQVPAFARARETAAGGVRLQDAIEAGKKALARSTIRSATQALPSVSPYEGAGMGAGLLFGHPWALAYYPAKVLAKAGIKSANEAVANRVGGAAAEFLTSPAGQALARLQAPADAASGMVSHLLTPVAGATGGAFGGMAAQAPAAPAAPSAPGSPSLVDLLRLRMLTGRGGM